MRVSFRVLGPVTVEVDGQPLALARPRQRALLGYLLLHRNTTVPTDRLVDAMWDGEGPATARRQVQTELSMLRRLVRAAGADDPITTVRGGYAITVGAGLLDLDEFDSQVRAAAAADDPYRAVRMLRQALDLWSGTPLGGVEAAYAPSHRLGLEERRLRAYEDLFEWELACGRHGVVIAESHELAGRYPLRERLIGQLMLALYRDGRGSEALALGRSLRGRLAEDHGLDPGRALQDLERAILRSDPSLDVAPAPSVPSNGVTAHRPAAPDHRPTPQQLPRDLAGVVGRGPELERLDGVLTASRASGEPATVILTGTAGVGKTTLAVHWAHRVAGDFPDGQLYVNLRGFDTDAALDPADALRGFLAAFGEPASAWATADLDVLTALYRTHLAGRTTLLLIDNARDAAQVRPLLPGDAACTVVITSRDRLTGLVATGGAQVVPLDVFSEADARDFMRRRLGAGRVDACVDAVADILGQCARLPLAVAIITARAATSPGLPLGTVARQLHTANRGLAALRVADGIDITATFSWSYDTLSAGAAALFRALGAHPSPDASLPALASRCGFAVPYARELADELVNANLAVEHLGERFSTHDLLRVYASERSRQEPEPDAAMRRMLDHYLHSAHRAVILFQPRRTPLRLDAPDPAATVTTFADRGEALSWLTTEHPTLVRLTDEAAARGHDPHAWQLGWCLTDFLFRVGHWSDWLQVQTVALAAATRTGDKAAMARCRIGLARAMIAAQRYADAHPHLEAARRLSAEIGDLSGEAFALQIISEVQSALGGDRAGLAALTEAIELYDKAANVLGAAAAHNNLAVRYTALRRFDEALRHGGQALRVFAAHGEINGLGAVHDTLGRAYHGRGDHAAAIEHLERAAGIKRTLGETYLEAMTLTDLGEVYAAAGDQAAAGRTWRQALALLERLDHPAAEEVRSRLARVEA